MQRTTIGLALVAGTAGALAQTPGDLRVFYIQDFETVDLGPGVDESAADSTEIVLGEVAFDVDTDNDGQPDVWSPDGPAGWTVFTPGPQVDFGVREWREWAFTSSIYWLAAADQRRSNFVNGFAGGSAIAVADADEWDDISAAFTDPNTGITTTDSPENITLYTTSMISERIDVTPAAAFGDNEFVIDFAFSWRPEAQDGDAQVNNQTAEIVAEFFDASDVSLGTEVVFFAQSIGDDPAFLPNASNALFSQLLLDDGTALDESGTLGAELANIAPNGNSIPVPAGAATVEFTFTLSDAGNDWWWAIDNITLSAASPTGEAIVAPGPFNVNRQETTYSTITPTITLTRSIEASGYTVEIADNPEFTDAQVFDATPADLNDILFDFTFPPGTVNTGQFFVRAFATNSVTAGSGVPTPSSNTTSFFVVNPTVGDLDGDGDPEFLVDADGRLRLDTNGDGQITGLDISDLNQDGINTLDDILVFTGAFTPEN